MVLCGFGRHGWWGASLASVLSDGMVLHVKSPLYPFLPVFIMELHLGATAGSVVALYIIRSHGVE